MSLSNSPVVQTLVWVVAGSAAWRLWDSAHGWLVWTLIPLLILEMAISATLKRVVSVGDSDMIKSEDDLKAFRQVWGSIHAGVSLTAVGLGIYGHTLA